MDKAYKKMKLKGVVAVISMSKWRIQDGGAFLVSEIIFMVIHEILMDVPVRR